MYIAYSPDKIHKDIGQTWQLVIDDDLVAVVKNVTRRQHTPTKHPDNPMIKRDQEWEGIPYFRSCSFNVHRDPEDNLFKCWYEDHYDYFGYQMGNTDQPPLGSRICYAVSKDGLTWEKPLLGRHKVDGQDTNTVIVTPDEDGVRTLLPSILLDGHEEDHSRRYKMVSLRHGGDGSGIAPGEQRIKASGAGRGLSLSFSENGMDWTPFDGNPLIPEWAADVQVLTYDSEDDLYVLWGRYGDSAGEAWHPDFDHWFSPVWPSKPEGIWGTRRRVWRLESTDLVNWSPAELIFEPGADDNLDDGHYSFVPWRAGEMHLGLLNVLHQVDDTLDTYLLHSRDGRRWNRFMDHRPFIPRGGEGSFDALDIETTVQPIVVGDELWFYYGGMNVHHDWWIVGRGEGLDVPEAHDRKYAADGHHLGLATLRYDGYVSLDAGVREGFIETKPVLATGEHLFINARCEPDGFIEVEVMDPWNGMWEGFTRDACTTFSGDDIRHRVVWTGGAVGALKGAVKFRIHLKKASFYGFQIANA